MKTFSRIFFFARPLGLDIPVYAILTLLATIFSVVNFTTLIPLLQVLFGQVESTLNVARPSFSLTIEYFKDLFYYQLQLLVNTKGEIFALYFICSVILSAVLFANIFRFLASLIVAKTRVRVITNLRKSAFQALLSFDQGYFSNQKKGDVISRMTTDVQEIELSVVATLKVLFKEPLLILGYFTALFSISAELTLYTLLLIPLAGGVISVIARKLKKRARKAQESLGRINNVLDEAITGMRIIKAFSAKKHVQNRFDKEVDNYGSNSFQIISRFNLASPVSEFLGVAVLSLILLIGGSMVLDDSSDLAAAQFIGFLILFSQVLNPAKSLASSFSNINRGIASAERVFELIDTKTEIKEAIDAKALHSFEKSIVFKNVSFAYGKASVINDISFEVKKGQVVALVGPSGGGKTTITDLIPRFYDTSTGQVMVDGIDIKELKIEDLRNQMGIVTQESILFNDSVANNILFGQSQISEDKLKAAARIANAHDFIENLESGYHTNIGERGAKLSGGQRQRICIARAIIKNPPILILDEATSSLDSVSEKLVQDAIIKLMENRTTIVIAHRLSTIQHADLIYVIDKGKIVEQGNHDSLIKKNGIYRKLTVMQSV
jgi:subfamily B ATP-binding cassette protein MsbA